MAAMAAGKKANLVLLYPDIIFKPLDEASENQDVFKLVRETEVSDDNRHLVKGMLSAPFTTFIGEKIMSSYPNLRVISLTSAGTEMVDIKAATKRGVRVGHSPAVSHCTADFAFALLMASARNVLQADGRIRKPDFKQLSVVNWFGVDIYRATLGIIGLGNIGLGVAKRAEGFDMKILYHGPRRKREAEANYEVSYCSELKDLLKESDFVILCAPLTPETRHMISAKELSLMKPTATLINIARGGLVNQDDLVTALRNGTIRAAAMDVTEPEPLPFSHPLFDLPNVIITPHIATATFSARAISAKNAMANLYAGLKGEQLPFPVNFSGKL